MATRARDDRRLAYIDSLRAIAAMLVLWTHVSESFVTVGTRAAASAWVHDAATRIAAGRLGVVAFFAISGFVIPFSIKLGHSHPVREFLVTRFFRLYPAYWLSVPLGAATMWLWDQPFSAADFLVNLTMLETLFDVTPAIGLYWTLAVELVFYVACIVLVLTRSITNYRRIAAIVVGLIAIHVIAVAVTVRDGESSLLVPTFWCVNIAIMFWGTLYRAQQRGDLAGAFEKWCVVGVGAFFVVVYPLAFTFVLHLWPGWTVGYSLGVLLFILGTRLVRLEWRPLAWLGLISYSIYLFHPVVFLVVLRWLGTLPAGSFWRSWHLGFYVLGILALTIGVAAIVYYCVERPAIRLGRRLAAAWFDKPASIAASA